MRIEVWVHADGEGRVPADALDRVRDLLGDSCLAAVGLNGRWSVAVSVEALDLREAMSIAAVQVTAAAAAAGLPAWPIEDASAKEPPSPDGTGRAAIAGVRMSSQSGDDGPAGVREPRRPLPQLPSLAVEAEESNEL